MAKFCDWNTRNCNGDERLIRYTSPALPKGMDVHNPQAQAYTWTQWLCRFHRGEQPNGTLGFGFTIETEN